MLSFLALTENQKSKITTTDFSSLGIKLEKSISSSIANPHWPKQIT